MEKITYDQMDHIIEMECAFYGLFSLLDAAIDCGPGPKGARIITKDFSYASEWTARFMDLHDLFQPFKQDERYMDLIIKFEKEYKEFIKLTRDDGLKDRDDTILSFKYNTLDVSKAIGEMRKRLLKSVFETGR